jgi:hypothetical protein
VSALRDSIVLHLQADANIQALVGQRIYPGLPPEGAAYPLITITAQRAPVGDWVFQEVAVEDATYLVKAIDRNQSAATVGEVSAAIRTALNLANLTITGYTSLGISWLADVHYDELANGLIYQHEGGLYQLMAEPI